MQDLALRVGPLYVNFARQKYDAAALQALLALAAERDVGGAITRLFRGEQVNLTEGRAALHTALRGDVVDAPVAAEAYATAREIRQRMGVLVRALEDSGVTDVVSVGIGGSDLGPRLGRRCAASGQRCAPARAFRVERGRRRHAAHAGHAGSGEDRGHPDFQDLRHAGNPAQRPDPARLAGGSERLYAVSANPERAAKAFAIAADRVLPMWDWVGGRYSLWSAVGFPIALAIGFERFEQLLEGAAQMDAHALDAPLERNLPVLHGLTDIWNRNLLGHATHAVMTYDQRPALLPAYLQQLVMESPGKRVQRDGQPVTTDTVPVWWGGRAPTCSTASSGAAPGHQHRSGRLHRLRAQRRSLHDQSPGPAGQPAGADRSTGQWPEQRRPAPRLPRGRPSTLILLDALTRRRWAH